MSNSTSALAEAVALGSSGHSRRMASASHRGKVAAAGKLFAEANRGDRRARLEFHELMGGTREGGVYESMSTSDFPLLFGDFLSRSLAQRYALAQPIWQKFAARKVQRDFRPSKIIDIFGAGAVLDRVPELSEFPQRSFDESDFELTIAKFGDRLSWSWEASINDDLSAFADAPQRLADAAKVTEDYFATAVLCDAAGPKTSLFGSPAELDLTADNLQTGIETITNAVDEDGNPILITDLVLSVPPALVKTAQDIVNTIEVRIGDGDNVRRTTGNGLTLNPTVVPNPWLTVINKSADAAKTWYLTPAPSGPRPAVYATFLTGYETPDLRVANTAGMSLGGGVIDPAEGSFERDSVDYRIRHVTGGNQGFTDAVFASVGA